MVGRRSSGRRTPCSADLHLAGAAVQMKRSGTATDGRLQQFENVSMRIGGGGTA